jgi:hypothetical protein
MLASELSEYQLNLFTTLERVSSVLSLFGIIWVLFTFLGSKQFHKPINRMVFYASIGNIFTCVATIISRAAVGNPNGALCQFQALLVQMYVNHCLLVLHLLTYLGFFLLMLSGLLPWP